MDQVYWLSTPLGGPGVDPDTRQLTYRYGRYVYAGPVITEPVRGLEYLPGVLQGIQAVQGQIPYMCEYKDLPAGSGAHTALKSLEHAQAAIYAAVSAHEGALAELAAQGGNEWLDADDAAVYFEFDARPGYTCNVRGCGGGCAGWGMGLRHGER
jgi:hypothetical protein